MGHLYSKISQNLQQGPMPHPALTWVKFGVAKWIKLTFCRPLHAILWAQCVTPPQLFKRPFLQDHPGEPVPEENWALWCKGRLTEADTPTIRLDATPSGLASAHLHHPPIFYRPDALPATHPTLSKH